MRMTQAEFDSYNARRSKPRTGGEPVGEGVENESDLHAEILQECRRRGWLALHGSMAHKARRTAGEPDFVILYSTESNLIGYGPRITKQVLLIECKTKNTKPSPAQLALHAHALKLGHTVHIVRDFAQFLALLSPH